jgi:hypothetical protein
MGKRAAHEGSVRQRRDGTWEARIQVGGVRVSRYGATRAEVVAKLHALQSTPVLRSTTTVILSEWVGQWIEERDLRPSARSTYERVLRPILRDLGHVSLFKLNPLMLSLQFSLLKERGVGARRVQLAHGYLKGCLAHAVEMGLIATNPMSGVKRPRWVPKTKRYWTFEETARFLSTCQSSSLRYAPLFLLIATTGLRISEALALEDGSSPTLTISGAVVWEQSRGYAAGEVKTPTSRRQVTVPEAGVGALSCHPIPHEWGEGAAPGDPLRDPRHPLCPGPGSPRLPRTPYATSTPPWLTRRPGMPTPCRRRLGSCERDDHDGVVWIRPHGRGDGERSTGRPSRT